MHAFICVCVRAVLRRSVLELQIFASLSVASSAIPAVHARTTHGVSGFVENVRQNVRVSAGGSVEAYEGLNGPPSFTVRGTL